MIRRAVASDRDAVVDLGLRFLRETAYAGRIAENVGQMESLADALIGSDRTVIVVAELDGALVGMIGMVANAHHISGEPIAGEVMWWVNPESRGIGVRLLRAAEQWAREQGAVKVHMIAPDAQVGELYQRLGYEAIETTYQRSL